MKSSTQENKQQGFSLVELLLSLAISLIIMGAAVSIFSGALSVRERESGRTDAITSAQAALSVMSREIGNAGFGLSNNGLVLDDCDGKTLHFRANVFNGNNTTTDHGEDITYLFDTTSQSVVRHDSNSGITSGIINRVSDVDFIYHQYESNGNSASASVPTANTGRVTIILSVILPDVQGQPTGRVEQVRSDVTLRNAPYMLGQY